MEKSVLLLREILAIPSVNGKDDEGKMAEYLCRVFQGAGLPSEVIRIDEKHADVVAVLEGETDSPPVVWNGHLDTVPYGNPEEWITDPAVPTERDGCLYARGASDMKGGLAAMVSALCEWKHSGRRPPVTIRFIGTCDEEKGGLGAEVIAKSGLLDGVTEILIGEPTGCRMGVAQKGCLWLEIRAYGKTSHGAYPQEGCNAVDGAVWLASKLKEYVTGFSHPVLGTSTAQITQISGGVAPNMTPDSCTALMDIRMVPGLTTERILARARKLETEWRTVCAGNFRAEFTVKNERVALEIDTGHPLVVRLARCLETWGLKSELVGINYFTDGSVFARQKPEMAVLLFGPGEPGMAHKPNECVDLELYRKSVGVLKDMIGENPSFTVDRNDEFRGAV